jgi:hypothetical protein
MKDGSVSERKVVGRVKEDEPATVIVRALVFLLAVKETTLSPKAMAPLTASAIALRCVISVAPYSRTRSSSPLHHPKKTHCMNASGLMRTRRSRGWSLRRPTWTRFVMIVFIAARRVPRRVRMKPQAVKE